jgi:hypothetical protein
MLTAATALQGIRCPGVEAIVEAICKRDCEKIVLTWTKFSVVGIYVNTLTTLNGFCFVLQTNFRSQ